MFMERDALELLLETAKTTAQVIKSVGSERSTRSARTTCSSGRCRSVGTIRQRTTRFKCVILRKPCQARRGRDEQLARGGREDQQASDAAGGRVEGGVIFDGNQE